MAAMMQRTDVNGLLLPAMRERVRDCLWFLALAQSVYAVTLLFSQGEAFVLREILNAIRLAILFGCVRLLQGTGSRRHTLAVAAVGLVGQLAVGVAISVVRHDVLPLALLTTVLTCMAATLIPWGARAQAALSIGATASVLTASLLIYRSTGAHLGFDPEVTLLLTFGVSTYIARFLERSRQSLEERLAAARATDGELAALRAQLEVRVAERTAELEMANRELESFSRTLSHDLRSPLRAVTGFSQLILDEHLDDLPGGVHAHLVKIQAASTRMDKLIDAMLMLARSGRGSLHYEKIDLTELARSVADEIAAENPDRRVELRIDALPAISADLTLLRIAFDKLLRNAWKFTMTREPAHVTVSGERDGDMALVHVTDDGVGFDPRFRDKLFKPFERVHDHPQFRGNGVGLATVARIVRRHGGVVDATGAVDQGATFTIILPLSRPR